jgi:hypothetical protein
MLVIQATEESEKKMPIHVEKDQLHYRVEMV